MSGLGPGGLPRYAMTYVAYWPDARGEGRGILKVGRAWRQSRLEMLRISGAHILICARGTDATWEREALRRLRAWFPQAFRDETEAYWYLWRGRGWTECFDVDDHYLDLAGKLIIEGFARGNEPGMNAPRQRGTNVPRRAKVDATDHRPPAQPCRLLDPRARRLAH